MTETRLLLGLSAAGSAADAVLVRVAGLGFAAGAKVVAHARKPADADPADGLHAAARAALASSGTDLRSVLAVGLTASLEHPTAEKLADRTGVSVLTGFGTRDAVAGGGGTFLTPAADLLLFASANEPRLLLHLGDPTTVLFLPAGATTANLTGFEAGPGTGLLDAVAAGGTRSKIADPGGTLAVQGKSLDDLLSVWLSHPYFRKAPPKSVPTTLYAGGFAAAACDAAKAAGATLPDLLCTVSHFLARAVGGGVRMHMPTGPRSIFVSGPGARNGFLWQLLTNQFPGEELKRTDELGVPATARDAAAAAVLTALTLDGVAANLPMLTGAMGGRLMGRWVPGDPRNWAAVTAWTADQIGDYLELRAA